MILAVGSRGDVQPFLALGVGLAAAGHQISVATHEQFAGVVVDSGLEFRPIGGNPREILESEEGLAWLEAGGSPIAGARRLVDVARPRIRSMLTDAAAACRDADGILYPPLGMAGFHIASRNRVPAVLASLLPLSRTGAFPAVGAPEWKLGRLYNRLTHAVASQFGWQPFRSLVNQWRVDVLGLPRAPFLGPFHEVERLKLPVLYGFSPSVVPRPGDWGPHIHVTGYWFTRTVPEWRPPESLVRFLAAGSTPVYVGFGSMTDRDPAAVGRIVLEAVQRAGCRAVLLSGWAGLAAAGDRPDVHVVDSVPHDWLFPKMAAVVHHGGAGTTHAGLRAGVPSVIVPFFTDQPFWAGRVAALGVGPRLVPRRELSAASLAAAIQQAVGDPGIRSHAEMLGRSIRAEDGVSNAVRVLDSEWPGV